MSGAAMAAIGFVAMLALIAIRMPVGLSMLVVGSIGYIAVHPSGWLAFFAYMKTNPYYQFANYTLSVIPLFILMGAFAERSGLATALFRAAGAVTGKMRGGLAMALIGACTGFGAICGSSVATTATFGRACLPEFRRYNYDMGFATGVIAVGGTLGILIPPSVILVVYAISTEQNIAKLFMAALIPGLLAALFYCVVIAIVVWRKPALAPPTPPLLEGVQRLARGEGAALLALALVVYAAWMAGVAPLWASLLVGFGVIAWAAWRSAVLRSVFPALAIATTVVGGIYGGIFTPTEGAAVGAIAMLAMGLAQRTLGWTAIRESLIQTAETSAMIFLILLGAEVFDAFLALTQLPTAAADLVAKSGLPPYAIMACLLLFYILLGAVMDELAMILLTLPVFFPVVQALDFGMPADDVAVWFGILVLIVVGIGLTCPPIGLNVFVISAIAKDTPIHRTYGGVLPFVLADIIRCALVLAFPALALWLVRLLS